MKSRLRAKIRKRLRKPERRRKLEEFTPGEIWGALKSWEGARSGAEYVKLDRSAYLEVVQTGYTYIFQAANILRPEELEEEEQRIKKGLAAGVLVTDARARLVDVKPRLEARVKQW